MLRKVARMPGTNTAPHPANTRNTWICTETVFSAVHRAPAHHMRQARAQRLQRQQRGRRQQRDLEAAGAGAVRDAQQHLRTRAN